MAQPFVPAQPVDPAVYGTNPAANFMQGMNMIYQPKQMKSQMEIDALKKAQLQQQNQSQPQMDQAKLALLNAQAQQAQQPKQPSGEYYGLLQYYNSLPPGQEKDMTKQRLDMLTSRGNGTTVFGENGQPLVQIGGNSAQGGAVQPGKLSTGEMPYFKTDDRGKPIQEGVMRPLTPQELTENRGRYIFNDLYPKLNESLSYYSGKDSWTKFLKDVNTMDKNPEARKHVIDYFTAQKTLPAVIAKEQQTLGASNTLGQFNALKKTMDSSDISKGLKTYAGFKMPPDVMNEAGKNLTTLLNQATEGSYNIPGYVQTPFNSVNQTSKGTNSTTQETNSYSNNYSEYHPKDKIKFDDGSVMTAEEAKKKGLLK